jgi:class 3 adenylate cyclase
MLTRIKKKSRVRVPVTILFADVRGYTTLSELLDTPEVIRLLSQFHGLYGEAVWERDGIVNKLIGDAGARHLQLPDRAQSRCHASRRVRRRSRRCR